MARFFAGTEASGFRVQHGFSSDKDKRVQDFLRKVTRIIALLLKDQTAPKELQKSVLRFLKIVITFLSFDT